MKKWKRTGIILFACAILITGIWIDNLLNLAPIYNQQDYAAYKAKSYAPAAQPRNFENTDGFVLVGENDDCRLYFNKSQFTFSLQGKNEDYQWDSYVPAPLIENSEEKDLSALFSAVVADIKTGNTRTLDNVKDDCSITVQGLKNGVALAVSFHAHNFGLTLQVFLDDSGLICRVPKESIVEDRNCSLVNMDILPFFGAAGAEEKGYILIPDGSGALYRFGDSGQQVTPITLDVYSSRTLDIDDWQENQAKKVYSCMLPAYGMVKGDNAFVAVICEGDTSSAITLAPSGYVYPLNRVYSSAVYRRMTAVASESGFVVYNVEEESRGNDYAVKYYFGHGDNADYSWMARMVRYHYIQCGRLVEHKALSSNMYLEFLMGVQKNSILKNRYISMTTVSEAGQILDELLRESKATVVLQGWQREGFGVSPGSVSAARSIGGKKALKNLFYKNKNATIALELPVVWGNTEKTGSRRRRDAVSNLRQITIIDKKETTYLLNANTQYQLLKKRLSDLSWAENNAILLSGAAEILYEDYNKRSPINRQQTSEILQAMMDSAGKNRTLILKKANAYALPYADFLVDMPQGGSGYTLLKESVPFYYLVINGSIPYSLDTAGNLSPDLNHTKLKWVEYGAIPYFLLSYKSSEHLIDTAADHLFATKYAEQKDTVAGVINEFTDLHQKLKGQRMYRHEKIQDQVYVSHYSNGTRIYINYGKDAVDVDGVAVDAMSYSVVNP